MFIIHIGYIIDLFLFLSVVTYSALFGCPPYQPSIFPCGGSGPRMRVVSRLVIQLGLGHRPPSRASPVVAAAGRTCALGQG